MSSRRRRSGRRRGALAAGALVVAAGVAAGAVSSGLVTIGRDGTSALPLAAPDTSAGTIDRGVGAPAAPQIGLPPAAMAPAAPPAADSLGDAETIVPGDSLSTGHGPGIAPVPPARSAPVAASTLELAALGAGMIVPVAGVARGDLVDSYTDARGEGGADPTGTRRHDALDILAPRGTPVLAATAGQVLKLFDSRRGGLTVYTSDASGRFVLLYGHLDRYAPGVREGMTVRQGEMLGYVGTTGNANPATPHLHFAVARSDDVRKWWEGTPVNPYPLLAGR